MYKRALQRNKNKNSKGKIPLKQGKNDLEICKAWTGMQRKIHNERVNPKEGLTEIGHQPNLRITQGKTYK